MNGLEKGKDNRYLSASRAMKLAIRLENRPHPNAASDWRIECERDDWLLWICVSPVRSSVR
jgi:hypothetical protein